MADVPSERDPSEWMRVLVRVEHVVEVYVHLDEFGTLADLANNPYFDTDYLSNRMALVEFDGYEVLTDADEIDRYEDKARWEMVVTAKPLQAATTSTDRPT